jgi:hypothetical protein
MKQTEVLRPQSAVTKPARRPLSPYVQQALVARAVARVGKGLACYGDKLPVVRAGAEIELDDTRRASLHDLHSRRLVVGDLTSTRCTPGPGDDLADAVVGIYFASWG